MLTQEQIQELQKKYGASNTSTTSADPLQSKFDAWDHAAKTAQDARHAMVTPPPDAAPPQQGFFSSIVKGVAKPFLRTGVTAYNALAGAGEVLSGGNHDGTYSTDFDKSRNLGFFGKIDPVKADSARGLLDAGGVGAELATNFMGAGAGKDLIQGAGESSIKGLVKAGAKQGAIIGATSGLGNSLQGDQQTVGKSITGTLGGAAIGGALGAATGGLTGLLKKMPWSSVDDSIKKTWETIQPKLNATEQANARAAGNITKKGILQTAELQPTKQEVKMIEAAHPFVNGAKDEETAIANMRNGISDEATKLREGLNQSKAIWSQNNLKGAINGIEKPHLLSGDLEKSFDKTLNVVLDKASGADKNLSGLLDVRQQFDEEVAKQYPNIYNGSDSMSAIKQAVKATRSAINDLIAEKLPNGMTVDGVSFKDSLSKQSLLYDAIDNVAAKGAKIGSNLLNRAAKSVPGRVIQHGLEGVGLYEGIKTLSGK